MPYDRARPEIAIYGFVVPSTVCEAQEENLRVFQNNVILILFNALSVSRPFGKCDRWKRKGNHFF